ncbi:MAG: transposase [Candidatus Handelsmanbacteria bacterium]|nr:transposase [Candidatus Handelsmanbacteria bacterium]
MTKKSKQKESGRFSSRRKMAAVLRLLRGEDLDLLSREYGVVAARLSQWREDFLCGGQLALQQRPSDQREEQIKDLQAKIGELTMANELLYHQVQRQASGRPFVVGRSTP